MIEPGGWRGPAIACAIACQLLGCASEFERRVEAAAPLVRREVQRIRGSPPTAPVAVGGRAEYLGYKAGSDMSGSRAVPVEFAAYFPGRRTVYVVDREEADEPAGLALEAAIAHELVHGLQHERGRAPSSAGDADARWAAEAAREGEAMLVQLFYLLRHDSARGELARLGEDPPSDRRFADTLRGHAASLWEELTGTSSPVSWMWGCGLRYALSRYLEGGWSGVEACVDRPPGSSAELLFGREDGYAAPALSPDATRAPGARSVEPLTAIETLRRLRALPGPAVRAPPVTRSAPRRSGSRTSPPEP